MRAALVPDDPALAVGVAVLGHGAHVGGGVGGRHPHLDGLHAEAADGGEGGGGEVDGGGGGAVERRRGGRVEGQQRRAAQGDAGVDGGHVGRGAGRRRRDGGGGRGRPLGVAEAGPEHRAVGGDGLGVERAEHAQVELLEPVGGGHVHIRLGRRRPHHLPRLHEPVPHVVGGRRPGGPDADPLHRHQARHGRVGPVGERPVVGAGGVERVVPAGGVEQPDGHAARLGLGGCRVGLAEAGRDGDHVGGDVRPRARPDRRGHVVGERHLHDQRRQRARAHLT